MLSYALMLAMLPYSTLPGLEMHITVDPDPQFVTAFLTGKKPKGARVIYADFSTFWPEVIDTAGNEPPKTELGRGYYMHRFLTGARDESYDVLNRPGVPAPPWRLGSYNLKRIYMLEPSKRYFVRGLYKDGSQRMRTRYHAFVWPSAIPSPGSFLTDLSP